MPRAVATETRRAPAVVEGTVTEEQAKNLAESFAALDADPRLWTGAFATNVWGGRYAIEGVLGEGAQGTTFFGTDLKTGARVAVKVFDLGRAKDWKAQELFDREVETLKSVEHPAIPRYLDVIVDNDSGARALVRTMIPGDSLAHVVKSQGPLAESALWGILVDVADVLGALHSRSSPIVHRDLKPSNLIRRPDGKVGLVDFGGVGRMRESAGSTVVGTFGYMAPEQLYGAQTPATDMYSLGATMLMLATGKEPEELPRNGLVIDVDKAAPALSERLRALLKKLVAPDPTGRPQDARALIGELRRIAEERPAEPEIAEPLWNKGLPHPSADAPDILVGVVTLMFGVLGAAGAVIVGQVLLPIILTILAGFSSGEQRNKLLAARARVIEAAQLARGTFESSAQHGARRIEEVSDRDRVRRTLRREEKEARKQFWKDEERRLKQVAKDARKSAKKRRDGQFWK